MSDATLTAQGGSPKVAKISEAVIRIAGNSQDGIQAIGGFLARLAGRSEQEVMTFMTIPSTISGGPSIFQVRIGSGEVLSPGDEADMLLAFYEHSYLGHISSLKKGGIVLYDSDHLKPEAIPAENLTKYRHVGVPISALTIEAIGGTGRDKGKNVFALGLLAKMFDLNVPKLHKLLSERFSGKDPKVAETALNAFNFGYNHQLATATELFQFTAGQNVGRSQVVMSGRLVRVGGLLETSVTGPLVFRFSPIEAKDLKSPLFPQSFPRVGGRQSIGRRAISRTICSGFGPNAIPIRRAVPNKLVTRGKLAPLTDLKSSAGPPSAMTRR